jgi:hypothetical protein
MELPSERNRAANKDGPLLIVQTITYSFDGSQIIYDCFLGEQIMERSCQKLLCINFKGFSISLETCNFLSTDWKELNQKCGETGELEIQFDDCGSLYRIP